MPQILRRIKPSSTPREVAGPRIHRIDAHHQIDGAAKGIHAPIKVARSARADSVRELHGIRDAVDELLLLASARDCLDIVGRTDHSSRKEYHAEAKNVVVRLRKLLGMKTSANSPSDNVAGTPATKIDQFSTRGSSLPLTKRRSGTSRIQIRLTKALVRVLAAFSDAGQKPSGLVERVLWKDSNIQDAAEILGIRSPIPTSPHRTSCGELTNTSRDQQ
ncbi:MAG TPA: hypothetical protein EYG03_03915 [Planctomycetes bacterium]|nr:hypothetical protein [Planctomycetota bacterium]